VSEEIVDGIHRGCRLDAAQRRIRLQGRVGHRRHGSEQCIATPGLVVLRRQSVRRRAGGRVERIVRVQEIGKLAFCWIVFFVLVRTVRGGVCNKRKEGGFFQEGEVVAVVTLPRADMVSSCQEQLR
jgi:hypothetical protein